MSPRLHLVTAFHVRGGSQERALQLRAVLARHADAELWSSTSIHPDYRAREVRRILPALARFPRGGNLVFVGTAPIGLWVNAAFPRRVVLIHNTLNADTLHRRLRRLTGWRLPRPEVVFCSPLVERSAGIAGTVQLSPIDLERFRPAAPRDRRPFTVGRLSRDSTIKFGREDVELFRSLAADGVRVRLMGATCLDAALAGAPGVEVLPMCAEDAPRFLGSVDCLLYRTSEHWPEPFGRVVAEAMACGLPVVCHRSGGYAEVLVEHERTGFLFGSNEEAVAIVRRLRDDPALRARLAAEARRHVERLYGAEEEERIRRFYCG